VALDQQFDGGTLHILREAVLAHATAAGMADNRAADVMLAVHELAANAVRHGGGAGRLQMRLTGGKLVFQVSDPGRAARNGRMPRGQHPAGTTDQEQPWPYQPGHGLWLVRRIADHVSAASGPDGSQVTAVFALAQGDIPGAPNGRGPTR
jgi:anti-sigma regulatory factor (Ser/Thr protein kinase)